jgi:hypothetical protein
MPHLAGEQLDLEQQIVLRQMLEATAPVGVIHHFRMRREAELRILVPVQLLPDPPGRLELRQTFDQRPTLGITEIRVRDIGVRPACLVADRLNPLRLVKTLSSRPVGLHIDGFDHIAAVGVGAKLLDRIIAADRLVGTENARHRRPRQPGQILQAPDVVVGVNGGDGLHGRVLVQRQAGLI